MSNIKQYTTIEAFLSSIYNNIFKFRSYKSSNKGTFIYICYSDNIFYLLI